MAFGCLLNSDLPFFKFQEDGSQLVKGNGGVAFAGDLTGQVVEAHDLSWTNSSLRKSTYNSQWWGGL